MIALIALIFFEHSGVFNYDQIKPGESYFKKGRKQKGLRGVSGML